jgi:hypothetical protein
MPRKTHSKSCRATGTDQSFFERASQLDEDLFKWSENSTQNPSQLFSKGLKQA